MALRGRASGESRGLAWQRVANEVAQGVPGEDLDRADRAGVSAMVRDSDEAAGDEGSGRATASSPCRTTARRPASRPSTWARTMPAITQAGRWSTPAMAARYGAGLDPDRSAVVNCLG